MNKYFKYYTTGLFVLGLALFNSCKDENELTSGFSIDKEEITIGENGGVETVQVSGDAEWQTTIDATWVRVLPPSGVGSTLCEVEVDSSVVAEPRYAEIMYMAEGGTTKTVKITQTGYMKGVFVENADQEIVIENSGEYGKRYYDLKVTANIEFDVAVSFEAGGAEWLKYNKRDINYDYGDRPRTFNLRFDWLTNVQESERTATVTITPKGDDANVADPLVLKFRQKSAPKITDNRAGDSLAILAIYESMNGIFEWDASENMMYWEGVELWKATDPEVKKNDKLLGRLKSVKFRLFETYESIPYQIKHLWTAKSISFSGNSNIFLKSIKLGPEICELAGEGKMLKELTISAYGLVELPDGFAKFGKNLEMLDLSSNNFEYKDEVTFNKNGLGVINSDNFKNLKRLRLNKITRYDTTRDLSQVEKTDSVGFRWKTGFGTFTSEPTQATNDKYFKMLLQWENLEELSLSLNLLEGELPSDEQLIDELGMKQYTEGYLAEMPYYKGDTITLAHAKMYLLPDDAGTHKAAPRVWPKMKSLSLNLNFLTGELPKWILYHPYLTYWNPFSMIFTQETDAINTDKEKAGFEAEPTNLSNYTNLGLEKSYYDVYPGRKPKNEDSDSTEE
ncbi:hypothetical protein [uncultured Bacteroides sp.]|uniref:hypothetical protein n=1 Tax=uncultured Bacteroides sp. TaxID=162156 RepID=UPI0025CDFEAA|nr:hypothetical protein [uncultured Bacteroides sp.]